MPLLPTPPRPAGRSSWPPARPTPPSATSGSTCACAAATPVARCSNASRCVWPASSTRSTPRSCSASAAPWSPPDRPSDNLYIDSSESLEHSLDEFRASVVGVTHDRWFMRTFDRFLYCYHQGDVSEALYIDTIHPVLAGEATVATAGRKLKRL